MTRGPHLRLLAVSLLVIAAMPAHAADTAPTMRIASLEWPPYVSTTLPQGGLAVAISAAAVKHAGYQIQIDHFPWNRAVQMGSKSPEYAGYFPTYYTEERAHQCHFSARFGTGMVGLAYRASDPLVWQSAHDLTSKSIGVVAGYSNGAAFDAMVRDGSMKPELSQSDSHNLRKLAAGRVQAIVIDRVILRHLLLTDTLPRKDREQILFHDKILVELDMHICFKKNAAGRAFQQAYDAGLKKINLIQFESDYFQQLQQKGASAAAQ